MLSELTFDLAQRRVRLSSLFRLVPIGSLTSKELSQLAIEDVVELAAVLMPTVPFLSIKGICQRTLELLGRFGSPSELTGVSNSDDQNLIAELILDSVLEAEVEGRFVCGPSVADFFLPEVVTQPTGAPARLSYEALQYAECLGIYDPGMLSSRLYFYNRIPFSTLRSRRFATEGSIGRWLALDGETHYGWSEIPPPSDNPSWRFFSRDVRTIGGRFKLYINAHCDFLPEAVKSALPALLEHGFGSFKISRELPGLLRPDKFVAYGQSLRQISSASQVLLPQLRGIPAHIVPFTAAIDEEGLLSWGIDPSPGERLSSRQGRSWRRWITDRLAVSLIAARGMGAASALRFALQRLAFDGIDVRTWAPTSRLWMGGVQP